VLQAAGLHIAEHTVSRRINMSLRHSHMQSHMVRLDYLGMAHSGEVHTELGWVVVRSVM
jgi:hypothetical protein